VPIGEADAHLEGSAGRSTLTFVSPVRFRRIEDDRIVVINRFGLSSSSDLLGAPLERLAGFETLLIPVITIVWGRSFEMITLFEATMTINGEPAWSYTYPIEAQFQEGPHFIIPLQGLRAWIEKRS